jgi:hypothetical protein
MHWLHPRRFTRPELYWILCFFLAAAILSTLPYLYFYLSIPPERHYTWASVFHYDDYFQYYAWANHIARGDWLIRNYYTGAGESGFGLFNPYFLVLGWLTRVTGNVYFATHALRIAGIAAFAWISYAFISIFLSEPRVRRAAQVLMFGGGLEFPFYLISNRPASPLADPYVFKILYRTGHLTAALSLVLLIFGAYLHALGIKETQKKIWTSPLALFALTLLLGLINPYYVVLVACVVGAHAAYQAAMQKSLSPFLPLAGLVLGGAAAYAQYRFQSLSANLSAIAFDDPIGPLDFILFFTFLLPLAIAGFFVASREGSIKREFLVFLAAWISAVFILILTPLEFRARMTFGLSLALAIPAAMLMGQRPFSSPLHWPIYLILLLDLVFTFYVENINFKSNAVGQIDRAMLAAFEEINGLAKPGDLVLAHGDTGNFIPAYTDAHVYIGHSFQTEHYYEKTQEFERFLTEMSEAQRAEYLSRTGARFLLIGPEERTLAPEFNFRSWPLIYDESGVQIFRNPNS